jgi:protein phosphatase 1 regulatory subunit 16A
MEHSELVAEMPSVERLSVQERLHLARRRRLQQLRSWAHNEKEWGKRRNSHAHNTVRSTTHRKIKFNNSVVLLEAAARNDIDEGAHAQPLVNFIINALFKL